MSLGYVVIEWNQASHQPRVVDFGDIYDSAAEAEDVARSYRARLIDSGSKRRERYTVAELVELDES
jgi:hypothetical protein